MSDESSAKTTQDGVAPPSGERVIRVSALARVEGEEA
jgi:hypothetical protein